MSTPERWLRAAGLAARADYLFSATRKRRRDICKMRHIEPSSRACHQTADHALLLAADGRRVGAA
jgi:hypothetical protein